MNNNLSILSALVFSCMAFSDGFAQQAVPASGGNATGSGGTAAYTIGQVTYNTVSGPNTSVAQGVQQHFEISVISSLEETGVADVQLSAFPNPVSDILTLSIVSPGLSGINYQLHDINGKLVLNGSVAEQETAISTKNLAPATYFLKVIRDNAPIKTFKIIKNK